jgi:Mg-chelatase subunit ChlD
LWNGLPSCSVATVVTTRDTCPTALLSRTSRLRHHNGFWGRSAPLENSAHHGIRFAAGLLAASARGAEEVPAASADVRTATRAKADINLSA